MWRTRVAGVWSAASPVTTRFPSRSTVIRSATPSTSSRKCDTRITVVPAAASRRIRSSRFSFSCSTSTAVGSSIASTRAPRASDRRISTCCWVPIGRSATRAFGSTTNPVVASNSSNVRRSSRRRANPARLAHRPRNTFSSTVRAGTSAPSWEMRLMPWRIASRGLWIVAGSPSKLSVPASARMAPPRILSSVLFPAPFSPTRQWISPGAMSRSMSRRTDTPL
jgi:hypothetical protein